MNRHCCTSKIFIYSLRRVFAPSSGSVWGKCTPFKTCKSPNSQHKDRSNPSVILSLHTDKPHYQHSCTNYTVKRSVFLPNHTFLYFIFFVLNFVIIINIIKNCYDKKCTLSPLACFYTRQAEAEQLAPFPLTHTHSLSHTPTRFPTPHSWKHHTTHSKHELMPIYSIS